MILNKQRLPLVRSCILENLRLMNIIKHCCYLLLSFVLFSCYKTVQLPGYPSYNGQWLYTGSTFGPFFTHPSADSVVILTLRPGNVYDASFNNISIIHGSFSIDSNANGITIQFLNITQPYGNETEFTTNGITYLFFNTAKIGPLTLFETNELSPAGDSIALTSYPITPEFTSNYFKRIQ